MIKNGTEVDTDMDIVPVMVRDGTQVDTNIDIDMGNIQSSVVVEPEVDHDTETDDMFKLSAQDILSRNPISAPHEPPPEVQFLEDLVYYRYGFHLDEEPYESPNGIKVWIKGWTAVCRSVGGQHLDLSSKKNQSPISDFVNILAHITHPFNDMPSKYWDLGPDNYGSLSKQASHFRIEVKDFVSEILCLLHPRGLESSKCPSWVLAVPPMTALECIRRGLGPDPYLLADYLTVHGMEFRTLQ